MSKNEEHYDASYWAWQSKLNKFGASYKGDIIRHILGAYPPSAGGDKIDTLLEFGCSGGYILDGVREKLSSSEVAREGLEAYGVEINPSSRAHAIETFPGIREVFPRAAAIPRDLGFDAMYSTSVLEHADCPLCELRELFARLNPGGVLVVGLKNDGADHQAQTFDKYEGDKNRYIYTWNALLLANMLGSAGFVPCNVISQFDAWHALDVESYERDRHGYCMKGLDEGKRKNVNNIWAVAVKSPTACSAYKARLDEILNCQYLK